MSRKSAHLDSAKVLKNIRKDLMSFAKDEILLAKNSHKQITITKFEECEHKVPHSKYSSNNTKKENNNNDNFKNPNPNIEIVDNEDGSGNDGACSSELSDDEN